MALGARPHHFFMTLPINKDMLKSPIKTNDILEGVRYEIRGELAARAVELERQGYEIMLRGGDV